MSDSEFSSFNANFYSKVKDLGVFDCQDFNITKVVLDGLRVNYIKKGKIRTYFFDSILVYQFISFCKRIWNARKSQYINIDSCNNKEKKILIFDVCRIVKLPNGEGRSLYFDKVISCLDKGETLLVNEKDTNGLLKCDYLFTQLEGSYRFKSLSVDDKKLRADLIRCFKKIEALGVFNKEELQNIRIAIAKFYDHFRIWNNFLVNFNELQWCCFVCHYHKEGQILALKKNGIKCIELQHGLIAQQDVFYVFPKNIIPYRHKMLFADKFLLYGQYWKKILQLGHEYTNDQLEVIGYYLYNNYQMFDKQHLIDFIRNEKLILVTTQTSMHELYISYVKFLENDVFKRGLKYKIIIKPHPSENIELYKNAFLGSEIVEVMDVPIQILFSLTNIHVSIYSTTLFDALNYELFNFSLITEAYKDYSESIIDAKVAIRLKSNENPVDFIDLDECNSVYDSKYFYEIFQDEKFRNYIS